MKNPIVHYIDEVQYKKIWIVAETKCGKYWKDIMEHSTEIERVTCKKCLKKIK